MPNILTMSHQIGGGGTFLSSDTMTKADSTTSMGSDVQAHVWTPCTKSGLVNTWGILSNQAYEPVQTGGLGDAYVAVHLLTEQVTAQVTLATVVSTGSGISFRGDGTQDNWFFWYAQPTTIQLWKYLAGAIGQLLNVGCVWTAGDVMKHTTVGGVHTCYKNGVSVASTTDTGLNANTWVGLIADAGATARFTTWSVQ